MSFIKQAGGVLAGCAISWTALSATQDAPAAVRAKSIQIVDEEGKVRIEMGPYRAVPGAYSIELFSGGERAIALEARPGAPQLLMGTPGQGQIWMLCEDDSSMLALAADQPQARVSLAATSGAGTITIVRSDGTLQTVGE